MFKIQVLNSIAAVGLEQFPRDLYDISTTMQNPDAILVRSQSMHDMPLPDSVKVIGRAGAGLNNIPVVALTKRGIPVLHTPGANANAVRELVLAGMLLASRHICEAWQYVNQLKSSETDLAINIEQHKKQFVGSELMGKVLGVIGLGSVGVKVANAAIHLGMHVVGYDPTITVSRAWELSSSVQQVHQLDSLLASADFVSVHVPLTNETKHMLNADCLKRLNKNAVLLNFSRDEIVDNQALLAWLNENQGQTYVTDFPTALLKDHPRVISLPHLGASTVEAEENCAVMIAKQVRDYLEKGAISYSANFPTVEVPHQHMGTRLAIVNANIPNMVAQMSATLASSGLNISSMINQSRGDIAYTLIDVSHDIDPAVVSHITKIEGVLQCRLL